MFNIPPSSLSRSFTEGKGGKRNHLIMKSLNYFAVCGNAGLVNKSANEVLLSGKRLEIGDGKRYPPNGLDTETSFQSFAQPLELLKSENLRLKFLKIPYNLRKGPKNYSFRWLYDIFFLYLHHK